MSRQLSAHSVEERHIISWLKRNTELGHSVHGGRSHRAAVHLEDGLFLPCVTFLSAPERVELVIDHLTKATSNSGTIYSFACAGNRVSHYNIASLSLSDYAIPHAHLEQIRGETRMGWTAFAGIMDDGKEFSFSTSFEMDFFQMPPGYTARQITSVIPHRNETKPTYSSRPAFICYITGL